MLGRVVSFKGNIICRYRNGECSIPSRLSSGLCERPLSSPIFKSARLGVEVNNDLYKVITDPSGA